MSLHTACVSGVRHEGTAEGKVEKIGNWDVYVALPKDDYPKDKAILFLTDVFGVQLTNNQLLADDFARNGIQVYMPDLFKGDPIPADVMRSNPDSKFNREAWQQAHTPESVWLIVRDTLAHLTSPEVGITSIGAVGYCFGAPFTMTLAHENKLSAAVFTHPSRLVLPGDLEALKEKSTVPVLFNTCEVDPMFDLAAQKVADELLGDGKYVPGYERTYWKGCNHGFAVRGDMTNPDVKAGKEGAFKATAEFFLKHL